MMILSLRRRGSAVQMLRGFCRLRAFVEVEPKSCVADLNLATKVRNLALENGPNFLAVPIHFR